MGHDILLREFILDIDEDWGSRLMRQTYYARMTRDPDPFHQVNEWQTEFSGGAVGYNSYSPEESARERFSKEILRLRALERKAVAEHRFADGRFTVGTADKDAG